MADVRARAEFHRPAVEGGGLAADLHDADGVSVLVAEELHDVRAALDGGVGDFAPRHGVVGEDALVDELLNVGQLAGRERRAVEVEGQLRGVDRGALLRGFLGDDLMERPVQDVRDRMVALDGVAAGLVDGDLNRCAGLGGVFAIEEVEPSLPGLLGVGDVPLAAAEGDDRGVADLAAHLGVAGGLIEDDGGAVLDLGDLGDFGLRGEGVVTDKSSRVVGADVGERDDFLLLRRAGPVTLLFHQLLETGAVDGQAAFAGHELGEVEREALLVIEAEGDGARDGAAGLELVGLVFKEGDALVEGAVEGFFFDADDVGDHRAAGADFREDVAHRLGEHADELMEEAVLQAERAAVADRAAQDAAEDVVTVGVAGLDAVGDRKGERTDVVGDDAEGHVVLLLLRVADRAGGGQGGAVFLAREFLEAAEERGEDVALVVGDHAREVLEILRALHDAGDAFEAHARVDVAGRERAEGAVGVGVELDEDQVPDFHAAGIAAVDERTLRVALGREVDVEFGARAAGAGLAHHPEIIFLIPVHDVDLGVEAGRAELLGPDVPGFLVELGRVALGFIGLVDRGVEAVLREFPDFGDQFPGVVDGLALEVVAEGPVAQHLEERVVVGVQADVFEVVMLTARADALLGVGGTAGGVRALRLAEEDRDELVHPGVGEE